MDPEIEKNMKPADIAPNQSLRSGTGQAKKRD